MTVYWILIIYVLVQFDKFWYFGGLNKTQNKGQRPSSSLKLIVLPIRQAHSFLRNKETVP